jgi:hypothetical protein
MEGNRMGDRLFWFVKRGINRESEVILNSTG